MAETPTCATCRYFDAPGLMRDVPPKRGICRVNAPSTNSVKPWPVVQRTDWCGEHPDLSVTAKDPVIPA